MSKIITIEEIENQKELTTQTVFIGSTKLLVGRPINSKPLPKHFRVKKLLRGKK